MKKNLFTLLLALHTCFALHAQKGINQDYSEPQDPQSPNAAEWTKLGNDLYVSWASRDVHYAKAEVPSIKLKNDTVAYAWRGERLGMEALLFSNANQGTLALQAKSKTLDCQARFVNYVLTDNFRGCGNHPTDRTPYLVPDVIDRETSKVLEARATRPVWCSIEVPRDAEPGTHQVTVEVINAQTEEILHTLQLHVEVNHRTLPEPKDYAFNLNFWQQPYAASRYYNVEPWSEAHIEALRPYMQMLARAGQKVATTILFYEPWGEQSNDKFEPMVETTKRKDGTWAYDYTIFDRYVRLLEECGIDKQINCFSMVPWDMSFRYMDEATGKYAYLKTTTSTEEYKALWTSFLVSFAEHLRQNGWFEKTCIAMDERGLDAMLDAYNIAQKAVPGIKMALAGNYHTELANKLYDYCLAYGQEFKPTELKQRNLKGFVSTCYTACPDAEPNICSNNNPSDAAYLPLHAIAKGFNGFLRWAWMNWTDDPLVDTRFRMFTPGDTYIVYPGGRSGIRHERIIEGVQAAEKVRILREEYEAAGNTEASQRLEQVLSAFSSGVVTNINSSARLVNYMHSLLNDAPVPPEEDVDDYCEVTLAAAKRDDAILKRWLTRATTTGCAVNLNYKATSPSQTGYVVAENPIEVIPGSTFTLRTWGKTNDDDLRYCRAALFADWDNDSIFNTLNANELVARYGNANTSNNNVLNTITKVTVPVTAKIGLSRLRLVFSDAWAAEPEACGELQKGFGFDIPMLVREEETSISSPTITGKWKGKTLHLSTPSAIMVYSYAGALVDYVKLTDRYTMRNFLPGNYLIRTYDTQGHRTTFKYHAQ